MALSTTVKNFCDGTLTIADGAALTFAIPYSNGDFAFDGLSDKWAEVSAYETRGTFNNLRHTTRTYPTGSFSVKMTEFTNVTTGVLTDALAKNGAWNAATGTLGTGLPYTVNLTFAVEGNDFGDGADHSVVFTKCRCTFGFAEGDPNTINVSFTCYGTVTGDLVPTSP